MLTRRPDAETPNPLQSTPPAVGATAVPTTENLSEVHIEDRIRQLLADIPTGSAPVAAMYVLLYDNAEGIADLAAAARELQDRYLSGCGNPIAVIDDPVVGERRCDRCVTCRIVNRLAKLDEAPR